MRLTTFADLIRRTVSYLGKDASESAAADAREAVIDAYQAIARYTTWNYYKRVFRIPTFAPYSTGTVVFDLTGGAFERVLTLTGGTWPQWAASGVVTIGNVNYEVAERKSNTQITLESASAPAADVASTTYRLFKDLYTLPSDFLAVLEVTLASYSDTPCYVSPQDFVRERRRAVTGSGRPRSFTVMGDPNFFGSMAIGLWQAPDSDYNLDIAYQARGRDLVISDYMEGTITTASGSDLFQGNGTQFTSEMLGSIVRIGQAGDPKVTGVEGLYRYAMERTIVEVVDADTIRVDAAADSTRTAAGYIISDPVDVEPNAMLLLLKRECEKQARLKTRMRATEEEMMAIRADEREHASALMQAMAADARFVGNRVAGGYGYHRRRLIDRGPVDFG